MQWYCFSSGRLHSTLTSGPIWCPLVHRLWSTNTGRTFEKLTPVTLHLDATGSVMSRIPNQSKIILYYAIVLPGKGKDKPPLPVSELISNEHSIPTLTFWQMETLRQLNKITTLIGSVLLAFNKESVSSYINRAHLLVSQKVKKADAENFTVIHLCSSHIIKAVTQ